MSTESYTKLVETLVRNPNDLKPTDRKRILAPDSIRRTLHILDSMIQDVDSQFLYHDGKMAENEATYLQAVLNGEKIKETYDDGTWEEFDPEVWVQTMRGEELKWKARTTRFLIRLKTARFEAAEEAGSNIKGLLDAVDAHEKEIAPEDRSSIDEDLYKAAHRVRKAGA